MFPVNTESIVASRISLMAKQNLDATQFNNSISGLEKRVYAEKACDFRKISIC